MEIFNPDRKDRNDDRRKIIANIDKLAKVINGMQELGFKVVTTIGTWDLLHIGHVRYLRKAKSHGDILVVGVDTDRVAKIYKGDLRPIIPEEERVEMVSYQGCVDFVARIDDVSEDGKWQYGLLKALRPDIYVAVEDSYPEEQLVEIKELCTSLVVLPRQAENTSTSKMIQEVVKKTMLKMLSEVEKR